MKLENTCLAGSRKEPKMELKKLLVPIDFSDCSKQALRYAAAYARQFAGEITLLAVIPNVHTSFEYGEVEAIAFHERQKAQFQKDLSQLAEETFHDVRHQVIVKTGRPFEEIVRAAKDLNMDLIVISTHGYPGITRVELGSTAERVVRYATCPVLVVRPTEHEFV